MNKGCIKTFTGSAVEGILSVCQNAGWSADEKNHIM